MKTVFEFKSKEADFKSWESSSVFMQINCTRKVAVEKAKKYAAKLNTEIRMNEKGRSQGHYFHPKSIVNS